MAFAGSREDELEMKLAGLNYEEIIGRGGIYRTVEATTRATDAELERLFVERAGGAAEHGTTTAERGAYVREMAERSPKAQNSYVFCDASAFMPEEAAEVFDAALRASLGLRLHADELAYVGYGDLAGRYKLASVDHIINMPDRNAPLLASPGAVALLPVTALSLTSGRGPPVSALRRAGAPIAIGTDLSLNSWCLNMQTAMELAVYLLGMTPLEALMSAAVNTAHSLGAGRQRNYRVQRLRRLGRLRRPQL